MNDLSVRVMVLDTWDEITLGVDPSTPVAELKARALAAAKVHSPADRYQLKFRGATVDESATADAVGLVPNCQLIVLPVRRRPTR